MKQTVILLKTSVLQISIFQSYVINFILDDVGKDEINKTTNYEFLKWKHDLKSKVINQRKWIKKHDKEHQDNIMLQIGYEKNLTKRINAKTLIEKINLHQQNINNHIKVRDKLLKAIMNIILPPKNLSYNINEQNQRT